MLKKIEGGKGRRWKWYFINLHKVINISDRTRNKVYEKWAGEHDREGPLPQTDMKANPFFFCHVHQQLLATLRISKGIVGIPTPLVNKLIIIGCLRVWQGL